MTMNDNLFLGDVYMQQRHGDLQSEAGNDRLAREATGRGGIGHRVAKAFGRFQHRSETKAKRGRGRPGLESTPSTRRRDALG